MVVFLHLYIKHYITFFSKYLGVRQGEGLYNIRKIIDQKGG